MNGRNMSFIFSLLVQGWQADGKVERRRVGRFHLRDCIRPPPPWGHPHASHCRPLCRPSLSQRPPALQAAVCPQESAQNRREQSTLETNNVQCCHFLWRQGQAAGWRRHGQRSNYLTLLRRIWGHGDLEERRRQSRSTLTIAGITADTVFLFTFFRAIPWLCPCMLTMSCSWSTTVWMSPVAFLMPMKYVTQLSNLWWIPNSVSKGFDTTMKTGSSRRFKRYPTTYR